MFQEGGYRDDRECRAGTDAETNANNPRGSTSPAGLCPASSSPAAYPGHQQYLIIKGPKHIEESVCLSYVTYTNSLHACA